MKRHIFNLLRTLLSSFYLIFFPIIPTQGHILIHPNDMLSVRTQSTHTRNLDDHDMDINFLAKYSIKFLGCHDVTQWVEVNKDSEYEEEKLDDNDENDAYYNDDQSYYKNPNDDMTTSTSTSQERYQILKNRLVRYRLCPNAGCNSKKATGCDSRFGDYVMELNDFVYYYLAGRQETEEATCEAYKEKCEEQCEDYDDDSYCEKRCYSSYGASNCHNREDNGNNSFDPIDYAYCSLFYDYSGGADYYNVGKGNYYVGPYCSSQGGSIVLGLFDDNKCSTFASCNEECFLDTMGYALPYSSSSSKSIIQNTCSICSEKKLEQLKNVDDDNNRSNDKEDNDESREYCTNMYHVSGKCESKLYNMDYPNESACTYIEGLKLLQSDGVIRTRNVKRSEMAGISIGFGLVVTMCLGFYVYYLRTKLTRAEFNLTASGLA